MDSGRCTSSAKKHHWSDPGGLAPLEASIHAPSRGAVLSFFVYDVSLAYLARHPFIVESVT